MTESNSHNGYNKAIYYIKSHMMPLQVLDSTQSSEAIQDNNVGRKETENDRFLTQMGDCLTAAEPATPVRERRGDRKVSA